MLRFLAPGTALRDALDNILRAKTGALIMFTDSENLQDVVQGGIPIDVPATAEIIYELAKMDGAIILDEGGGRVRYANAQLVPDPTITASETGIRHRSAERVARQTGALVIAVSQRRALITIYKGSLRYQLRDQALVLARANQALQTLEKYSHALRESLDHLTALELQDLVTLNDVVTVLRRVEITMRVSDEITFYIAELGAEGSLIELQRDELVTNIDNIGKLVVRDYIHEGADLDAEECYRTIRSISSDRIDPLEIARVLGYAMTANVLESPVTPRGYRILSKVPRLPARVAAKVVQHFRNLQGILAASPEDLDEVEGVGKIRARTIIQTLSRYREQLTWERRF